jgi:tetratricopeptide (TPR) repeat protein
MDLNSAVVQLCIEGTRAEYAGKPEDAQILYQRAWEIAANDYEACIAAHYVARFQNTVQESLHWNKVALAHADAVADHRIHDFYPSLYLSLGKAYELVGELTEARRYYDMASTLGFTHKEE